MRINHHNTIEHQIEYDQSWIESTILYQNVDLIEAPEKPNQNMLFSHHKSPMRNHILSFLNEAMKFKMLTLQLLQHYKTPLLRIQTPKTPKTLEIFSTFLTPKLTTMSSSSSTATSSSPSSWTCSTCTFINPPAQKSLCQICLTAQPSSTPNPSSSTFSPNPDWPCKTCTFLNPFQTTTCQICGARNSASLASFLDHELDDAELGKLGTVFLPLKACSKGKVEDLDKPSTLGVEVEKSKDLGKGSGLSNRSRNGKRKLIDEDEEDDDQWVFSGQSKGAKSAYILDETKNKSVITEAKGSFLRIMTYNVWFRKDLELHRRMKALGELIQLHSPDIICFQEVTSDIYDIFKRTSWWAYNYSVSTDKASSLRYFCMQLSRLPVRSYKTNPFRNSCMGRELCLAEVEVQPDRTIVVATSHLESPCPRPPKWDQMFSKERVEQANETIMSLNSYKNVIFCGDMNWDDKRDGQFPISDGWFDAWSQLRPGDVGYTYDTKSNKMLTGNWTLQKRLDRFLCKLNDFDANEICMIGMDAIPGLTYTKEKKLKKEVKNLVLPVLPSDHYGLLLTIRLS